MSEVLFVQIYILYKMFIVVQLQEVSLLSLSTDTRIVYCSLILNLMFVYHFTMYSVDRLSLSEHLKNRKCQENALIFSFSLTRSVPILTLCGVIIFKAKYIN